MTNNHLLLYRLAELMLEKQQHILALDDLFEDEQIGAFVRSIQIDSPYQQLIFEGVLTETIKEERVMVTFTVEGYFHYVLGEVIEQQAEGKGAEALKELLENNQLRGITEGIEQCLVRDVEKNDLSRLMWLIDEGGKALEASAYPLAQAFLIHPIERVMDELFADPSDNDIDVLEKAIKKLESAQQNDKVKIIYKKINSIIKPDNILKANLFVKSITYIPKERRKKELDKLSSFTVNEENEIAGDFYFSLAKQFEFIADYNKAIKFYKKSLDVTLKLFGGNHKNIGSTYNNMGFIWKNKGDYDKAIDYYNKDLDFILKNYGNKSSLLATSYNNLGSAWSNKKNYNKALKLFNKAIEINIKNHGKQHPRTALYFNNIGLALYDKGNYDQAIDYYEKSIKIKMKLYDKDHISISTTYNNIGLVWSAKKNYDKAIKYYQMSLEIKIKVHENEHPSLAISHNNLGLLWSHKKNYDKAIYHLEKALKIEILNHGNEHPSTLRCYNNLGAIWKKKGQYKKAIKYYEEALKIEIQKQGIENSDTGYTFFILANLYLTTKNFRKALDYFRKGFISHPDSGGFPFKIAICYENLNQLEEATKNYCLSAEIRKKASGIEDDGTQKAIKEAIRLAKETNNLELLPDWIKKNSQ